MKFSEEEVFPAGRGIDTHNRSVVKKEGNRYSGISWERVVSVHEYDFLKSYLYAVYAGNFSDECLKILRCVGHSSLSHRPQSPSTTDGGSDVFRIVNDGVLEVTLIWQGANYEVNISKESMYDGLRIHAVYCLGLSEDATKPGEVGEYCLDQALRNSFFKNRTLGITAGGSNGQENQVRPIHLVGRPLSEIFLSEEGLDAINLFVKSVKSFDTIRKPMRYLLNGKPGTGKTETILGIIEECRTNATFLVVEGPCNLREVFELASLFSPGVLCLDDIDLICGDRRFFSDRQLLGDFLGLMDGFQKSNVFVLTTTNDKQLVDVAAARPGRFDLVLDMDISEPSLYLQLVRQRCTNETLVQLFDESVLGRMQEKKVTGAFVVNLLKHLEMKLALSPEVLNSTYVLAVVERMSRGFHRDSDVEGRPVGFGTN